VLQRRNILINKPRLRANRKKEGIPPPTGKKGGRERMDPYTEKNHMEAYMHLQRYQIATTILYGKILDLGCGLGYGTKMLKRKASLIIGVEISSEALSYAKERYWGPHYILADIRNLPFKDGIFDGVTAFEVVEHVRRGKRVLTETRRVLKKGGTLILSSPNKLSPEKWLINLILRKPYPELLGPYHFREYSYKELIKLIGSAGFQKTKQRGQLLGFPSLCGHLTCRFPAIIPLVVNITQLFPQLSRNIILFARKR